MIDKFMNGVLRVALWVVLCTLGLINLALKVLVFLPNAFIVGLHDYIDRVATK